MAKQEDVASLEAYIERGGGKITVDILYIYKGFSPTSQPNV